MRPQDHFGENLRRLRESAGWTQMELANRADMDMSEISRFERGGREPRLNTIVRLADALGVPPAQCIAGIGRFA